MAQGVTLVFDLAKLLGEVLGRSAGREAGVPDAFGQPGGLIVPIGQRPLLLGFVQASEVLMCGGQRAAPGGVPLVET